MYVWASLLFGESERDLTQGSINVHVIGWQRKSEWYSDWATG